MVDWSELHAYLVYQSCYIRQKSLRNLQNFSKEDLFMENLEAVSCRNEDLMRFSQRGVLSVSSLCLDTIIQFLRFGVYFTRIPKF